MKNVLRCIYAKSFQTVIVTMIICIIAWGLLNRRSSKSRIRVILKYINFILYVATVVLILYTTVVSRNIDEREICVIPLYSFVMAQNQPEMYRSMLMNVLLFVPYGITMPYTLKHDSIRRVAITIFSAFVIAFGIEIVQCLFYLGRAEVDDVLCNTLGAMVGCISYWISDKVRR